MFCVGVVKNGRFEQHQIHVRELLRHGSSSTHMLMGYTTNLWMYLYHSIVIRCIQIELDHPIDHPFAICYLARTQYPLALCCHLLSQLRASQSCTSCTRSLAPILYLELYSGPQPDARYAFSITPFCDTV